MKKVNFLMRCFILSVSGILLVLCWLSAAAPRQQCKQRAAGFKRRFRWMVRWAGLPMRPRRSKALRSGTAFLSTGWGNGWVFRGRTGARIPAESRWSLCWILCLTPKMLPDQRVVNICVLLQTLTGTETPPMAF